MGHQSFGLLAQCKSIIEFNTTLVFALHFLTGEMNENKILCAMKTKIKTSQPYNFTTRQRREQIKRLCKTIVEEFQPEKIILFGSFANGKPDAESDIDLLVVMQFEGSPFRQAGLMLNQVSRFVGVLPLDLLVRTSEQLNERLAIGDTFVREILERGKVIYEANHA
jgi:predicted nucleotidyltransferase